MFHLGRDRSRGSSCGAITPAIAASDLSEVFRLQANDVTMTWPAIQWNQFFCSKLCLKKLSTSAGRIDFKLCMITLLA